MRFVWRTIRFTVFFGGDLFLLNAFSAGRPVIAVVPAGARAPSPVQTTTWFTRVQSRSFASSTWFFLFLFLRICAILIPDGALIERLANDTYRELIKSCRTKKIGPMTA